jgi:hypothetical protein
MSLDLLSIQDEITAKLKEIPQDVYETTAPDDSKLKFDPSGMILPYVVIEYSDMYPGIERGGIISSRYDVGRAYAIVSCVGPTQRSARQVANVVRDKLTGFIPADAGEMVPSGGSISYTEADAKPNRFVAELSFTLPVNTVW